MKRLPLFLIPFCLAAVPATADPARRACAAAEALVDDLDPDGPGVAVAVYRSGRVACERVTGRSGGERIDRHSRFYVASLAKTLTAATVLRLADAGRLDLHASVHTWFSELPSAYAAVTPWRLLRHQAGVADHFDHIETDGLTDAGVLEFLVDRGELDFAPGRRWSYSNAGYVLLGLLVERVTGRPFPEHLRDDLLRPAGMADAVVGAPPQDAVVASEVSGGGAIPTPVRVRTTGAGGLHASLADLGAWLAALRGGELLSGWALAVSLAPTLTEAGGLTPFAVGWQVEDARRGLYYAASFGRLGGNHHAMVWFPDRDLAYVFLSARSDVSPFQLIDPLVAPNAPSEVPTAEP